MNIELSDVQRGVIIFIYCRKHYGFIQSFNGEIVFFHEKGVCNSNFKDLREGMEIEFLIQETPKGKKAFAIVVL